MAKIIDEKGNQYGRLTVVERKGSNGSFSQWLCRCDCGKEIVVRGNSLRTGNTQSCGCVHSEQIAKRNKENSGEKAPSFGHKGPNSPNWKGGRFVHNGYAFVLSPGHPRANKSGHVQEHVLVMEQTLKAPVPKGAEIHHCDENRTNNGPFNLRLFLTKGEHTSHHARLRQEGR